MYNLQRSKGNFALYCILDAASVDLQFCHFQNFMKRGMTALNKGGFFQLM